MVVDAGAIADAIVRYPVGMLFFTTPERLEIGGHPLVSAGPKATREEALKYYRGVARAESLNIRTYTRIIAARRNGNAVQCSLRTSRGEETITTNRLVLATGYFDHPNRLEVPGEDLPHVSHYGIEPHLTSGQDVVIVGAKNSAIEQALACYRAGARVTVLSRGAELKPSVKYWLRPDFENRVKGGEIAVRWSTSVTAIRPGSVAVQGIDGSGELPSDRVLLLTGYHPDFDLFASMGITLDDEGRPALDPATLETNVPGIYMAGSVTGGRKISEIFIENGRYDGEKIFGDTASRTRADQAYQAEGREVGE